MAFDELSLEEIDGLLAQAESPTITQTAGSGMNFDSLSLEQIDSLLAQVGSQGDDAAIAKNLGRSLAKGTGNLAGLVGQLNPFGTGPQQLGVKAASYLTGQEMPGVTDQPLNMQIADDARSSIVNNPQYDTATGRVIGAAVEAAPFALLGGGIPAALASGAGGQIATESEQSPFIGSLIGGAVPGLLTKGAGAIARPFTQKGQQQIAADTLKKAVGKKGVENIANYADDAGEFGQVTLAEVAKTPGAAGLQKGLMQELGDDGGLIIDDLASRAMKRGQSLDDLVDDALVHALPEERGEAIRKLLTTAEAESDELVGAAWKDAKLTDVRFDTQKALDESLTAATETGSVIPLSSNANRVIRALEKGNGTLSTKEYQGVRSAAGRAYQLAANKGDMAEARVMAIVRSKLDDAALDAAESGAIGADDLTAFKSAVSATRQHKQKYESGAIGKLLKERDGAFSTGTSIVPKAITKSPESAKEFTAKFGGNAELAKQGKSALLDELATKKDSVAKLNFMQKKESEFKHLFGDDYKQVQKVIMDLDSEVSIGRLEQMATGRGSITGQKLSSAEFIKNASMAIKIASASAKGLASIGGITAGASGGYQAGVIGAIVGAGLGSQLKTLAAKSEGEIKRILVEAMRDPNIAKELIKTPTESGLQAIFKSLPLSGAVGVSQEIDQPNHLGTIRGSSNGKTKGALGATSSTLAGFMSKGDDKPAGAMPKKKGASGMKDIKAVEAQIDADPIDAAIYEVESGRNPTAKNPHSSASGGFQLINQTARALGVKDPFDLEQNYNGYKKLRAEHEARFGSDPRTLYSAHFLGATLLNKYIKGKELSSKEKGLVKELEDKALPRFDRIYSKVLTKQEDDNNGMA